MVAGRVEIVADSYVSRIAVQRVDIPGRWYVVSLEHVAFAFLGSAANHGVIHAPWIGDRVLVPNVIYVRSVKGALFRTGFSTLDTLRQKLNPARFVSIHRLLILNVNRVVELDLSSNSSLVGVMVGPEIDFLPVSRRHLRILREQFGLPKRIARRHR
jgi:hypothetical protein